LKRLHRDLFGGFGNGAERRFGAGATLIRCPFGEDPGLF
jgi:hypothetical protein